ncbi:disease resistance protein RPV1-like [Eucalyptus grandis]|uniref:disease resistance protein RPV1-like n=1 Tax=Eucalyptus grandis TaxID=71139 RepID=UPI00192E8EED|nr:disease resistance protein RPV1-like [Eucalyptus grandis]
MANSEAGMSSDAARASVDEYQVFLSFRGPDTRHGFTSFLHDALLDAGVHVFLDNEELRVGEVIGDNLLKAINNSTIYIPIFSPTYASSKWCLCEIKCIMDNVSKSEGTKSIFPIFFHIELEDVKLRTSLYADALLKHKANFPDEVVDAWSAALAKVGEIKGWTVAKEQSQPAIVKSVVEKVLEKTKIKQKLVTEHLVGFDDRVKELTMLLDVKQDDVRLIGIYGMGGIGKTAIAKVIFNQLSSHFGKYCSFLEGVQERLAKGDMVQLQKKLLHDILCSGSIGKVNDSEQGMRRIGETLGRKMVLVVLDDVNEEKHIRELIGSNSLCSGSRIIITTRSKATLEVKGFKGEIQQYEMLKMDDHFALQLFYQHALDDGDFPSSDYHYKLSSEIVSHAGGLPLAIKVMGSLLKGKQEDFWKETLVRLTKVPEKEIQEKLRISYNDLDEDQRRIFLDIACFFCNERRTDAIHIWTDSYPIREIKVLIDRCLIKILDNDKLWMHDQLIDLGWQIVHEESSSDLGKRSRLRIAKENLEIITTKEKKDEVRALQIDGSDDFIEIKNEEFERLRNLKFLKLCNGTFAGDFTKCHSKLRWISWQPPFREFRASNMNLDHLVVFKLGKNDFKDNSKAWDLIKKAQKLKVLSLVDCDGITTNPDFSKCSGLERLTLQRCNMLKRIESFIGNLKMLIMLEIEWCPFLTNLPKEVGALVKLERFLLRGCPKLGELPDSLGNLTSMMQLDLSGTGIAELPNFIKGLVKLESLLLKDTMIRELPNFIGKLKSLRILGLSKDGSYSPKDVSYSPKDNNWQFPNGMNMLTNLEELDLSKRGEMKGEVPVGIGELIGWAELTTLLFGYSEVEDIPLDELPQLKNLTIYDCKPLHILSIPSKLRKLRQVSVSSCSKLVEIQIAGLSQSLESFSVYGCESLRRIGGLSNLKNLEKLEIKSCNALNDVEGVNELRSLKSLKIIVCKSLGMLIDASCTNIPDDCLVNILSCGEFINSHWIYPFGICLERYIQEILLDTSNKIESPFTIDFFLKIKQFSRKIWYKISSEDGELIVEIKSDEQVKEMVQLASKRGSIRLIVEGGVDISLEGVIIRASQWGCSVHFLIFYCCVAFFLFLSLSRGKLDFPRKIEQFARTRSNFIAHSVTCEGLIVDVKGFGFLSKRMQHEDPGEYLELFIEIMSDEQVKGMLQLASKRGFIQLFFMGEVDREPGKF